MPPASDGRRLLVAQAEKSALAYLKGKDMNPLDAVLMAVMGLLERVGYTEAGGFGVFTVLTPDCGYETAIKDSEGFHLVERYEDRKSAEAGHKKWVEECKKGIKSITQLGWLDVFEEETIDLVP